MAAGEERSVAPRGVRSFSCAPQQPGGGERRGGRRGAGGGGFAGKRTPPFAQLPTRPTRSGPAHAWRPPRQRARSAVACRPAAHTDTTHDPRPTVPAGLPALLRGTSSPRGARDSSRRPLRGGTCGRPAPPPAPTPRPTPTSVQLGPPACSSPHPSATPARSARPPAQCPAASRPPSQTRRRWPRASAPQATSCGHRVRCSAPQTHSGPLSPHRGRHTQSQSPAPGAQPGRDQPEAAAAARAIEPRSALSPRSAHRHRADGWSPRSAGPIHITQRSSAPASQARPPQGPRAAASAVVPRRPGPCPLAATPTPTPTPAPAAHSHSHCPLNAACPLTAHFAAHSLPRVRARISADGSCSGSGRGEGTGARRKWACEPAQAHPGRKPWFFAPPRFNFPLRAHRGPVWTSRLRRHPPVRPRPETGTAWPPAESRPRAAGGALAGHRRTQVVGACVRVAGLVQRRLPIYPRARSGAGGRRVESTPSRGSVAPGEGATSQGGMLSPSPGRCTKVEVVWPRHGSAIARRYF